jgi:hypothetical protein
MCVVRVRAGCRFMLRRWGDSWLELTALAVKWMNKDKLSAADASERVGNSENAVMREIIKVSIISDVVTTQVATVVF